MSSISQVNADVLKQAQQRIQQDLLTALAAFSIPEPLKAAKLIDRKLRPEIIIIGRGVNYNFLDEYIKKNNLGDFVKLHGFHQNAFKFIKDTNILVLTSKFECI